MKEDVESLNIDDPGSHTDCTRPSNLEKDLDRAAVACLLSIAKAKAKSSENADYTVFQKNGHPFYFFHNSLK